MSASAGGRHEPEPRRNRDLEDPDKLTAESTPTERKEDRARQSGEERAALFHDEEAHGFRSRWDAIQTGFVDEPAPPSNRQTRSSLRSFHAWYRSLASNTTLEREWGRDRDVSTEDLRVALTRYRAFFDRLLSV